MSFTRLAAGASILALLAAPAFAQKGDVAAGLFAELAANDEVALTVLTDWFGTVPAEHQEAYVDYLQDIAADPAVVRYVVGITGQPTDPSTYLTGPVQTAILSAANSGISLLDAEDQLTYYQFARDTFDWVALNTPAGCRALLAGGTTGDDPSLEFQNAYQATLTADRVTTILGLSREALTATVADAAPATSYSPAEIQQGLQAYQTAILGAINAHPNAQALGQAAANLANAPEADVCTVGTISLDVLLDLPDPQRAWAIQGLATQM